MHTFKDTSKLIRNLSSLYLVTKSGDLFTVGDIQATMDLSEVFEAGFDLSVTVADHRTTIAARVLTVHLQSRSFTYF